MISMPARPGGSGAAVSNYAYHFALRASRGRSLVFWLPECATEIE